MVERIGNARKPSTTSTRKRRRNRRSLFSKKKYYHSKEIPSTPFPGWPVAVEAKQKFPGFSHEELAHSERQTALNAIENEDLVLETTCVYSISASDPEGDTFKLVVSLFVFFAKFMTVR